MSGKRLHPDHFIGNSTRKVFKTKRTIENGKEIITLFFQSKPENSLSFSISISEGYSIIRVEDIVDNNLMSKFFLTPKKNEKSGIWFPDSYEYQHYTSGKLDSISKAEIEVISLNQKISEDRFEIPAFGLPPLTRLESYPGAITTMVWDGEKVRPMQKGDLTEQTVSVETPLHSDRKSKKQVIISLGIISFLLFLIVLIGRWIRIRSKK